MWGAKCVGLSEPRLANQCDACECGSARAPVERDVLDECAALLAAGQTCGEQGVRAKRQH